MEYKDLHPFYRLMYWRKRHSFTEQDYRFITGTRGNLQKGELPWSVYVSILSGVAFVVCIAAFQLWAHFAVLFCCALLVIRLIAMNIRRTND